MSDKKFLIHVCVELAVIATITFWLYSKISNKDEIIARLEKENQELKQRVENIENFLRQLGGVSPPQQKPEHMPATTRPKKTSPTNSKDEQLNKSSDDEEIEL